MLIFAVSIAHCEGHLCETDISKTTVGSMSVSLMAKFRELYANMVGSKTRSA